MHEQSGTTGTIDTNTAVSITAQGLPYSVTAHALAQWTRAAFANGRHVTATAAARDFEDPYTNGTRFVGTAVLDNSTVIRLEQDAPGEHGIHHPTTIRAVEFTPDGLHQPSLEQLLGATVRIQAVARASNSGICGDLFQIWNEGLTALGWNLRAIEVHGYPDQLSENRICNGGRLISWLHYMNLDGEPSNILLVTNGYVMPGEPITISLRYPTDADREHFADLK